MVDCQVFLILLWGSEYLEASLIRPTRIGYFVSQFLAIVADRVVVRAHGSGSVFRGYLNLTHSVWFNGKEGFLVAPFNNCNKAYKDKDATRVREPNKKERVGETF